MKKIITLITCFILCLNVQASDIKVTANNAFPPSNLGSLLIELDPNLGSLPFQVSITGPSYSYNQSISNYTLGINDLSPGFYCINVINNDGCAANICIDIQQCRIQEGNIHCSPVVSIACCHQREVLVAAMLKNPSGNPGSTPYSDDSDFLYQWYNAFDIMSSVSASATAIVDTTYSIINQLIQTGSTVYDVPYQTEIDNPDAMVIISYDSTHQIQWVWHNFPEVQYKYQGILSDNLSYSVKLYPIPTKDALNASWTKGEFTNVSLVNLYGQQIFHHDIDPQEDSKLFDLRNQLPGVYFMLWNASDGTIIKRKVVIQR